MSAEQGESLPFTSGLECIGDKFSEAYDRQLNGEDPIQVLMGFSGRVEVLALNPKRPNLPGDNVRYLLSGGTLGFGGVAIHIGTEEFNVNYGVVKITLSPDDTRPISELGPEDLALMCTLFVSDEGKIAGEAGLLTPDEQYDLLSSIKNCVLSTEPPGWTQEQE